MINFEKLRVMRDKLKTKLLANRAAGLPYNPRLKFYYDLIDEIVSGYVQGVNDSNCLNWLVNHNGYKIRFNHDRKRYDFVSFDNKHWRQSFYISV